MSVRLIRMSLSLKKMIESSCEGQYLAMTPEEAMEFLDSIAKTSRRWEEFQLERKDSKQPTPKIKDKVHESEENIAMILQIELLTKRLEELESKFTQRSKMVGMEWSTSQIGNTKGCIKR